MTDEQTNQITATLTLFNSLTGLHAYCIPLPISDSAAKPCTFCPLTTQNKDCISRLSQIASHMIEANQSSIKLCSAGLCRIIVPILSDNKITSVVLTDPVLCNRNQDDGTLSLEKTEKACNALAVMKITDLCKSAQLLRSSLGCPSGKADEKLQNIKYKANQSIRENNPTLTKNLLNSVPNLLVDECGTDFEILKEKFFDFFLFLKETAIQNSVDSFLQSEHHMLNLSVFAKANNIGQLKYCFDMAVDSLINAVFCPQSQKHASLILKATEYIEEHYNSKLSQSRVAALVYLSPSYFSKVFKENLGCSFNEYINYIRIEKAKFLLKRHEVDIDRIAETVGFESRSYFGKVFKAQTGMTPKQFRQNHI